MHRILCILGIGVCGLVYPEGELFSESLALFQEFVSTQEMKGERIAVGLPAFRVASLFRNIKPLVLRNGSFEPSFQWHRSEVLTRLQRVSKHQQADEWRAYVQGLAGTSKPCEAADGDDCHVELARKNPLTVHGLNALGTLLARNMDRGTLDIAAHYGEQLLEDLSVFEEMSVLSEVPHEAIAVRVFALCSLIGDAPCIEKAWGRIERLPSSSSARFFSERFSIFDIQQKGRDWLRAKFPKHPRKGSDGWIDKPIDFQRRVFHAMSIRGVGTLFPKVGFTSSELVATYTRYLLEFLGTENPEKITLFRVGLLKIRHGFIQNAIVSAIGKKFRSENVDPVYLSLLSRQKQQYVETIRAELLGVARQLDLEFVQRADFWDAVTASNPSKQEVKEIFVRAVEGDVSALFTVGVLRTLCPSLGDLLLEIQWRKKIKFARQLAIACPTEFLREIPRIAEGGQLDSLLEDALMFDWASHWDHSSRPGLWEVPLSQEQELNHPHATVTALGEAPLSLGPKQVLTKMVLKDFAGQDLDFLVRQTASGFSYEAIGAHVRLARHFPREEKTVDVFRDALSFHPQWYARLAGPVASANEEIRKKLCELGETLPALAGSDYGSPIWLDVNSVLEGLADVRPAPPCLIPVLFEVIEWGGMAAPTSAKLLGEIMRSETKENRLAMIERLKEAWMQAPRGTSRLSLAQSLEPVLELGHRELLVQWTRELLTHPHRQVREGAVKLCSSSKVHELAPELLKLLKEGRSQALAVTDAISRMGQSVHEQALPKLRDYWDARPSETTDRTKGVSFEVSQAFARMGTKDPEVYGYLVQLALEGYGPQVIIDDLPEN